MPLIHRAHHFLHYDTLGDPRNPPLLLIMGLAVSSRAWGRLPELMSHDFYVLSFDNRGTGGSPRPRFAHPLSDPAGDAPAAVEAAAPPAAPPLRLPLARLLPPEPPPPPPH